MKKLIKLMSVLDSLFDSSIKLFAYMAVVILIFITISISLDVILRYTMNYTIKWVFGITEYSLLLITFLGTGWVLKNDGHVKLDLLLNALGERLQAWLNAFTSLIVAGICLIYAWTGATYTLYLIEREITITKYYTVPKFAFVIFIPLGFFLLFIQALRKAFYYFRTIKQTKA